MVMACETQSPTTERSTQLRVQLEGLKASQVIVHITPTDDRVYYYSEVLSKADFQALQLDDAHYMKIKADEQYRQYLDWRKELLYDNTQYIADFYSYAFSYGNSSNFYINLTPETDYYVLSFCIHPVSKEPIGKLQRYPFTTPAIDMTTVSQMVLDFRVQMYDADNEHIARISIRPSLNSQATKEPYLWTIVSDDQLAEYDHDISTFCQSYVSALFENPGALEAHLSRDITTTSIHHLVPGKGYTLLAAAAYRYTWMKAVYTLHFTYRPNTDIPYQHDSILSF